MPGKKQPSVTCGQCAAKTTAEETVYSRFTGNHYCADRAACERRTARLDAETRRMLNEAARTYRYS